ncbi:amino acid transporter [Agrococcus sp. UYP33]
MRFVALGVVVTVLGLALLPLTEPTTTAGLEQQPRAWAVGVVVLGLCMTIASLLSRSAPSTEPRSRRPGRPSWLLLAIAACGLITLAATVSAGYEHPWSYVSPTLLTVYPLAMYSHQSWRYRRFVSARAASPRRRAVG